MRTAASVSLALAGAGAVKAADLTSLVDLFIGTARPGNAFPGAAVPHGMAKVVIDVTSSPRQAGYVADSATISGISLMHDEGTGGNANGGYGIFPLFPLTGCDFASCKTLVNDRAAKRAKDADKAAPGYFTSTFENGIKLETTSTRRAGLIKFTWPSDDRNRVIVDLSNDLQRSFHGGSLALDVAGGRVKLGGTFQQSYGPDNYTAFACYDWAAPPAQAGTYSTDDSGGNLAIKEGSASVSYPWQSGTRKAQAGALLAFTGKEATARFGVSMISADQACANAEAEVPDWDWDGVRKASEAAWEDVLERVVVDTEKEDASVVKLLYSSLYRASLVPANLTGENPYWKNDEPFYDALFCSWDTFRTVHPLLSITSPYEWAEIVRTYIDGWRNTGYIPECRSNTKPGYVQGGSDGMPILGDFAAKYGSVADKLGVNADDLYQALKDTAENTPPDWYRVGRQNTAWKQFGYIPTDWKDPTGSTGLATREASRALEYALGDFAVRQAALALGKSADDVATYANRSMNFLNHWDPNLEHDGFKGFSQRRYANGSFAFSPPDACSPVDPTGHSCARGSDNNVGFYESSSWEYSFFAPQSVSTIVKLMGGADTYISRIDRYFSKGYFLAGNEPSFEMPWMYHYVARPDLSAKRVRNIVYSNFGTGTNGLPGNDDSGAMASLLVFHMLGLYPVPASTQLLLGSPFVSSYTLNNRFLGTSTTVRVDAFDPATLSKAPPEGSRLYVKSVTVNGKAAESICFIEFGTLLGGGEIVIEVDGDAAAAKERGCVGPVPDSLEEGGFAEPGKLPTKPEPEPTPEPTAEPTAQPTCGKKKRAAKL
ncbi:hypothetical protein AURDEDRAFT_88026 [Auricularia subglabra TFB-10046 SS5]|nr:hypothetical protein AURDEDRAFT_88026 [Auricularia subglabra TFB-10046 SS5]